MKYWMGGEIILQVMIEVHMAELRFVSIYVLMCVSILGGISPVKIWEISVECYQLHRTIQPSQEDHHQKCTLPSQFGQYD